MPKDFITGGVNLTSEEYRVIKSINEMGTNGKTIELNSSFAISSNSGKLEDIICTSAICDQNKYIIACETEGKTDNYLIKLINGFKTLSHPAGKLLEELNSITGEFVFAIMDSNGNVSLCRSYPGVMAIYYVQRENRLIFSTDISLFSKLNYQDVKSVRPGSYISFSNSGQICTQWYKLINKRIELPVPYIDLKLRDAVASKVTMLNPKRPIGLMLSGGVDSALLAEYLSIHRNYKTIAFTIDGEGSNDARMISEKYGMEIHILSQDHYCEYAKQYQAYDFNRQFSGLNTSLFVPVYAICKFAETLNVSAVFSGDGMDEIFGGYDFQCDMSMMNDMLRNITDNMHLFSLDRLLQSGKKSGVAVLLPYLDKEVINAAFSLSPEWKVDKKIIRTIADKYFLPEIAWRKKIPMQVSTKSYEIIYGREWLSSYMSQ
jgi:asparagine synthase (glutamine-hydrolysing)